MFEIQLPAFSPSAATQKTVQKAVDALRKALDTGQIPHYQAYQAVETESILAQAKDFSAGLDHIFVLGTGGSRSGAEAFVQLTQQSFQGIPRETPQLHFISNIDPTPLHHLFQMNWPWEKTGVLIVSKSGSTPETLSQCSLFTQEMEKHLSPAEISQNMRIVTENPQSLLGLFAKERDIPLIMHPTIGGRFSGLTLTGLLPAALAGCDIQAIQRSACTTMEKNLHDPKQRDHFLQNLCFLWEAYEKNAQLQVMFLYGESLQGLGAWYGQLLAESSGKDGKGLTPLIVKGTDDQHSQLQLFQDGPADKTYTFVRFQDHPSLNPLSAPWTDNNPCYARQLGALFDGCYQGTYDALTAANRPCRQLHLAATAESFGAFMGHMTLEVLALCELLEVNAFDQPGVEQSKKRTQKYMLAS